MSQEHYCTKYYRIVLHGNDLDRVYEPESGLRVYAVGGLGKNVNKMGSNANNDVNVTMTTNTLNRCTICSMNCEGFNRNSDYLNDVLTTHRPTVFCIQETWILDDDSSKISSIYNDYVAFSK